MSAGDQHSKAGRGRLIGARVLTVLAVLVAFVGMLSYAVERTVLDESGVKRIATAMIQDDAIREQVALAAVEQLYANVDVEQAIAERLPPAQRGLAPALAGLSRQAADQGAEKILQRPRAQAAWVEIVTRTQRQLVKLLEDKGELIRTEGGEVVLDLHPIIIELGNRVAIIGSATEQLPPSAGRIVIVKSNQLDTAQTAVSVLHALSAWLWVVALALAVGAVWLARGRRRIELRALAIGFLTVGVLLLLTRRVGGSYLVDQLTSDATRPAGWDAWSIATQELADRAWVWITGGALVLAGTWLVGPSDVARRARAALAPVAKSLWWTYGIVVGAVLVLATFVPLFGRSTWASLVLAALLVVGVETVRRMIRSDVA